MWHGQAMAWSGARSGALSPRSLKQVRRDDEILALYDQDLTYDQIAARTDYVNASGPLKAVRRALDRVPHPDQALDA